MINADLMFENLGYEKKEKEDFPYIWYCKDYGIYNAEIEFDLKRELINCNLILKDNEIKTSQMSVCLSASKVQAILQKCIELGWNVMGCNFNEVRITEEEKTILKGLNKKYVKIGRKLGGNLYIGDEKLINSEFEEFFGDNLFNWIKEGNEYYIRGLIKE